MGMAAMVIAPAVIASIVITMVRCADNAADRADRATHTSADSAADNTTNRPCRTISAIGALFGAADDALRMACERRRKQHQKGQGGCPCKGSFRRPSGGRDCFHFRLSQCERVKEHRKHNAPAKLWFHWPSRKR